MGMGVNDGFCCKRFADIFESLAFANDLKYFVNPFGDFQIIFHPICQAFLSRTPMI
jgi:hypothetical protein